jgi:hypothetical protein
MDLKRLLVDTCKVFDRLRIDYVLIGGYAGILYGSPYTTADIDFVVVSEKVDLRMIEELAKVGWVPTEYYGKADELRAFGQFVYAKEGYPLHILPHVAGYKIREDMIRYEKDVDGYGIRICAPEDLIIMRLAVWSDIDKEKAICLALANKLDRKYLRKRAKEEKLEKRLEWLMDALKKG